MIDSVTHYYVIKYNVFNTPVFNVWYDIPPPDCIFSHRALSSKVCLGTATTEKRHGNARYWLSLLFYGTMDYLVNSSRFYVAFLRF